MAYGDYVQPTMEYSVQINGTTTESGAGTVSFITGYNGIAITHKCTNQSINNYQVWVTKESTSEWGLGIGVKAYENLDVLSKNTDRVGSITATSSIFTEGDGVYRLALCARGELTNTWDVTEILIELSGLVFKPSDADAVELIVSDTVTPVVATPILDYWILDRTATTFTIIGGE